MIKEGKTASPKTALRVLTTLTEKQHLKAADVEELRAYAPAFDGTVDELACEVIQKALEYRADVRNTRTFAAGE